MKKLTFLLLTIGSAASTIAQNVDWVNAPVNPLPMVSDLKYQNLKGEVFQQDFSYYSKNGKHNSLDKDESFTKDEQGRTKTHTNYYGNITIYTYDNRGNLATQKGFEGVYNTSYEYDNKNRIIQESYVNKENKKRNTKYTYQQKGDLVIVKEISTDIGGGVSENERHFKNGNEVFAQTKGYPGIIFEYKFDKKGNWISKSQIDANTKKPRKSSFDNSIVKPYERSIIYYDEYENRHSNMTAVLRDILKGKGTTPILTPDIFISGKQWKKQIMSRFGDDYIFFDPQSNIYYIVRNAYAKSHKEGDKLTVEKLISGSETVLFYNAKNVQLCIDGKTPKEKNKWKYIFESTFYVVGSDTSNAYYFFEKPTNLQNTATAAMPAINILKNSDNVLYYVSKESKALLVYEGLRLLTDKYTVPGAVAGTEADMVLEVNGKPKYVLTNYTNAIDRHINRGRYYDPSKDKIRVVQKK